MAQRSGRLQALHDDVREALCELELELDSPAHDGWLAPGTLARAATEDEPLLLRAAVAQGEAAERRTPPPTALWWLRSDGGRELDAVPMRGGASRKLVAERLRLVRIAELCCDAPKCDAERVVGQLWLDVEGEPRRLLLAEIQGDEEDLVTIVEAGRALAARLSVDAEGLPDASGSLAPEGAPLDAWRLCRWSLRREGEHFVLRDHALGGPRSAVPRELAILTAMTIVFAASWYATWATYVAGRHTTAAIAGATALVMTFFVLTMAQIVRHSLAYRGKDEALMWMARDQLVVAPWHDRDGAIDVGTAGRYGASIPLSELASITVVELPVGRALRCDTAHGLIDVGVLEDDEQAQRWLDALRRLVRATAHAPGRGATSTGRSPAAAALALVVISLLAGGCAPAPRPADGGPLVSASSPLGASPSAPASAPAPSPVATSSAVPSSAPEAAARPEMIEDDVPAAMREAKRSGKAVFVEVWAPWCHTCLSMKNFVLPDPALAPLRERLVFAAVDSDRDDNAAFMDRYAVNVWPTLFVIEPEKGDVVSLWQGAASVNELRTFLQDAVDSIEAGHAPDGPVAAMIAAKKAHAVADWSEAARHYQSAVARGGHDWSRRSEALAGLVFAEYRQGHWERCAQLGADHAASIEGAAVPADFSWVVLDCADEVKAPALRDRARAAALARLKRHTEDPPAAASVDDRSDALNIYAGALSKAGDRQGARAAREAQIALLEAAAAKAPGPAQAATFDYARMGAYLALGRGEEAVAMLRRRREQLPDSYEPPARLAQALIAMRRDREALAPLEDAVDKAYGPRKLGYLTTLAELRGRLGDPSGEREALEALLAVYGGLSDKQKGHRSNRERAEKARQRLASLPR